MTFTFRHPKYYKELRMQYGPQPANCDSEEKSEDRVAQGPGLKLQASSSKRQAPSSLNNEPQASSPKQKGSSFKPEASSAKIPEPGNN